MNTDSLKTLAITAFDDAEKIGSNCRKEDNFLELKHVLAAANDPNSNLSGINWSEVNRLSAEILGKESKDILVASYLAVGLLKIDGVNGLLIGLEIIDDLISAYWDTLYPPLRRLNGRWSAFEWLIEQLSDFLDGFGGQKSKSEIDPVIEKFKSIEKNLSALSEEAPNFLPLIRSFERIIAPEKVEATIEQEVSTPEKGVPEGTSFGISVGEIASVDDALDQTNVLWENAAKIANFLKEKEVELAMAYRLARMSIWQVIRALPPSDKDFVTRVPPPDRNAVKQLNLLLDVHNYKGIISTCELWAVENPYWFDLHFNICVAFDSIEKSDVSRAIKCELLSLYHRHPNIIKLKFSDKKSMMSDEALLWLQEDLASDSQPQSISLNDNENLTASEKKFLEELDGIQQKPKNNRLQEYADIQHYLDSDISENLKIELLIGMVDAIIPASNNGMLESYVSCLETKLEYFHLESWDKVLASKVLIKIIEAKKALNESFANYYHRLCRIDMHAAIACHK